MRLFLITLIAVLSLSFAEVLSAQTNPNYPTNPTVSWEEDPEETTARYKTIQAGEFLYQIPEGCLEFNESYYDMLGAMLLGFADKSKPMPEELIIPTQFVYDRIPYMLRGIAPYAFTDKPEGDPESPDYDPVPKTVNTTTRVIRMVGDIGTPYWPTPLRHYYDDDPYIVDVAYDAVDIPEYCFYNFSALEEAHIFGDLNTYAFGNCKNLRLLETPDSTECKVMKAWKNTQNELILRPYALANCSSLQNIDTYIRKIQGHALYGCNELKTLRFNKIRALRISEYAISDLPNLQELELPATYFSATQRVSTIPDPQIMYRATIVVNYYCDSNLIFNCPSLERIIISGDTYTGGDVLPAAFDTTQPLVAQCPNLRYVDLLTTYVGCWPTVLPYLPNNFENSVYENALLSLYKAKDDGHYNPNPAACHSWYDKVGRLFKHVNWMEYPSDNPGDVDVINAGSNLSEYYSLAGVYCGNKPEDLAPGIYVMRRDGKTSKVAIK